MTLKTFLYKATLTVSLMAALAAGFEALGRRIPTSYSVKHRNLMARAEKVEVLVLGSSHANAGINPQVMGEKVYNISNVSQDFYYDHEVLKKYLPHCRNLKAVILPVSYFSLFYKLSESEEAWRSKFYASVLYIPREDSSALELSQYSSIMAMEGPFKILRGQKNQQLDITAFGYQRFPGPPHPAEAINEASGKARASFHHRMMKEKNLADNLALLRKTIELLRSRHIQVYLVSLPVYETYYHNLSPRYLSEMKASIDAICGEYHCKYYDYLSDSRFGMGDFVDNDHLCEDGATKFSSILKRDIIEGI